MSLCIATSVPDGIILCSDTLQTMQTEKIQNFTFVCNPCGTSHQLNLKTPVPIGTFPTAQKQHHLKIILESGDVWSLGILNAGNLNIGAKRVSKLIRDFEKKIDPKSSMGAIAENLKDFFVREVLGAYQIQNMDQFSADPIRLILCGYDMNEEGTPPRKFVIRIEKNPTIIPHHDYGSAWIGRGEIPSLFNNGVQMQQVGLEGINLLFNMMNIQDAIDYNRFLITTVMGYQKFARMAADVGGEIEIGIIRAGMDYHWLHRHAWV